MRGKTREIAGRVLKGIGVIWSQAGLTLLLILLCDGAAKVLLSGPARVDPRAFADGYHGAKWAPDLWREYYDVAVDWHPYFYWLAGPHRGRYFNVEAEGLRWTLPSAFTRTSGRPVRIFTFGGSTMFGEGVRDDYTIASWLQAKLDSSGYEVAVTNFGQDGFVSTQEVLQLAEQLRRGNIPDLVIFYDGANDIETAVLEGRAGLTWDEHVRAEEFNLLDSFTPEQRVRLYKHAVLTFLMSSALGRIAKRIARAASPRSFRMIGEQLVERQPDTSLRSDATRRRQDEVVAVYLMNVRTVTAVANAYGFRALFYWQPMIFNKKVLTPWERQHALESEFAREADFVAAVDNKMQSLGSKEGVRDLTHVFENASQPVFFDSMHITEDGNRMVVEAMLPSVLTAVSEIRTHRAGGG